VPDEKHRIVFAGGGTGGHLYPALSVADELRHRLPGASIGFIGARRGLEQKLVPQAGYPLRSLNLAGIKGRGAAARAAAVTAAGWAVGRCLIWMTGSRPRLVIGVGGYASGPPMVAARVLRVSTMIMEQNHYPGATNRWLARRVDAICVPSEAARQRLGGRGVVTGNPVRGAFFEIGPPPGNARLSLLVFGGSRGAHSLNLAMLRAIPELARFEPAPTIVHQTGPDDEGEVAAAARDYPGGLYEVHAFLDDMPERLANADLVVSRSGASTLAELAAAGRPAVLVPYPHAADDHQRHNAEAVCDAGAAELILDGELEQGRLLSVVRELATDPERRQRMARDARTLAVPGAAAKIADIAEALLAEPGGRHVS